MKSTKANAEISVGMGSSCTTGLHCKLLTTTKLMSLNMVPTHLQPHKAHFVVCHPSFIPGEGKEESLGYHTKQTAASSFLFFVSPAAILGSPTWCNSGQGELENTQPALPWAPRTELPSPQCLVCSFTNKC